MVASTPHLYELNIKVSVNGRVTDEVSTYFGMRKSSEERLKCC